MEYWLVATLQRLDQQISQIKDEVHEAKVLMQRLAILGGLWGAVLVLGYHSPEAQQLVSGAIKSFLLKH